MKTKKKVAKGGGRRKKLTAPARHLLRQARLCVDCIKEGTVIEGYQCEGCGLYDASIPKTLGDLAKLAFDVVDAADASLITDKRAALGGALARFHAAVKELH